MNSFTRRILFSLFFLSGACSLIYQIVWTRMAFASFGIVTPILSVVLSVFMLGLAIGSWAGGRWIPGLANKTRLSPIFFYAAIEAVIGCGAFIVPRLFKTGEHMLLGSGETNSLTYLSLSALVLAVSILPWCVCMGATFPAMMTYLKASDPHSQRSFSFLYLANVLGAMSGIFFTAAIWIELLGFRHTLWVAAACNFTAAFISICLAFDKQPSAPDETSAPMIENDVIAPPACRDTAKILKLILFLTGFVSMAMEVVWTRAFAPALKTQVYSFAAIVFAYLGATFFGSWVYRRHLRARKEVSTGRLVFTLAVAAFLPVIANDARLVLQDFTSSTIGLKDALLLLGSICPFCALLGYLTPRLIDHYSGGDPSAAGRVYAINVAGCILGPLLACYLLLPFLSERHALILLASPFLCLWLVFFKPRFSLRNVTGGAVFGAALAWCLFFSEDFEGMLVRTGKDTTIRRDYAASVISVARDGKKWLVVNGMDMTTLTPITKFMVHLPLVYHQGPPRSILVICFGMGTSYRSALSWDIDTTAVELIPSVPKAFGFYHADTARCLSDPNGRIIVDDGRRYLNRCGRKFDVIIVDPPPPIEAAGSSLLYSKEFCMLARDHLEPGGILNLWFPGGDVLAGQGIARSLHETFPYVRCFRSIDRWGTHFLASLQPIENLDARTLAGRMPESARADLVEWAPSKDATNYINQVLEQEFNPAEVINPDPNVQLTDDRPCNEYFLLRWLLDPSSKKW